MHCGDELAYSGTCSGTGTCSGAGAGSSAGSGTGGGVSVGSISIGVVSGLTGEIIRDVFNAVCRIVDHTVHCVSRIIQYGAGAVSGVIGSFGYAVVKGIRWSGVI